MTALSEASTAQTEANRQAEEIELRRFAARGGMSLPLRCAFNYIMTNFGRVMPSTLYFLKTSDDGAFLIIVGVHSWKIAGFTNLPIDQAMIQGSPLRRHPPLRHRTTVVIQGSPLRRLPPLRHGTTVMVQGSPLRKLPPLRYRTVMMLWTLFEKFCFCGYSALTTPFLFILEI